MEREVVFGNTFQSDDLLTYGDCELILNHVDAQPPAPKLHIVELPASDGVLDQSTALTDGELKYSNRMVTLIFIAMHKTLAERRSALETMIRELHGKNKYIRLPDSEDFSFYGRCSVSYEMFPGYIIITVTADCEPYRYAASTIYTFSTAAAAVKTVTVVNPSYARSMVPVFKVTTGTARITNGDTTLTGLTVGTYKLYDMTLSPGDAVQFMVTLEPDSTAVLECTERML